MGLMYLSAPLVFGTLAWYPKLRRPCIMVGLLIMCLSLGLSSLSTTVPHLIASQGVSYAIGGALCYSPTITYMDEWFVKRKGLAFGIMWVGFDTLLLPSGPQLTSTTGWHRTRWRSHPFAPAVSPRQIRLPYDSPHLGYRPLRLHCTAIHIPQTTSTRVPDH